MNIFRVAFIGHREITDIMPVENKLDELVCRLLSEHEFVEFYLGRNGDFDILAASTVKKVQKRLGKDNSSLILVLPYHMKDEGYYSDYYDEIIIPINSHPKSAITARNFWMVENVDLLVAYVMHKDGGAYKALKHAQKCHIPNLNIKS